MKRFFAASCSRVIVRKAGATAVAVACRRSLIAHHPSPMPHAPPPSSLLLIRTLASSSSSSSSSSSNPPSQQQKNKSFNLDDTEEATKEERIIKHPSMETEKEVGLALREVQDLYRKGKYTEALEISKGLKDWLERELGEDHPVYASCLNNIALMHKMVNELEEATHYYTLALHKYKKIVGTSHRSYAATLNNLGLVFLSQAQQAESKGSGNKLQSMGYLESAEVTLREVLRIRGDILEEDDPALLTTRSNLASVLQRTGRGEEGEELLRTTLARVIDKKGRESPEVAMALNNLGYLLKAEGRWEEAAGFYEEALVLRRSLFPADHPQIIISLNNLAELYLSQEPPQEDKAKVLQEEILGILQGREGGGGGD